MQYKVSELVGALLDEAVARAMGYSRASEVPEHLCGTWFAGEGDGGICDWSPSTTWTQGGPIIEGEKIELNVLNDGWCANLRGNGSWQECYYGTDYGLVGNGRPRVNTPLIAAMRAYVASKVGETIELP